MLPLRAVPILSPMSGADDAEQFVLSLRHAPGGGPSGTLRVVGEQKEKPFEGWIGLIGLVTEHRGMAMDHATTMRSTYERINAGDITGFGDLVADDFVEHQGPVPGVPSTKEGTLEFFRILLAAFPDMRMDVEDLIASDDKTVARVKITATHKGEFMGVPPTGTRAEVELIDIMRFDDAGLVCEHWGVADMLSLMQQLGVVPAGPPA
jgi:steroid delta-isomerase-like uncharacterized protein